MGTIDPGMFHVFLGPTRPHDLLEGFVARLEEDPLSQKRDQGYPRGHVPPVPRLKK